jgi:3-isopropylmalate dehydratase small subunit
VGLSFAGVKAVICKSVNRIFYRSSVNQGLPIILLPEAVDAYKQGDDVVVDLENGIARIGEKEFPFAPLPEKLMNIFKARGLVNYIKEMR